MPANWLPAGAEIPMRRIIPAVIAGLLAAGCGPKDADPAPKVAEAGSVTPQDYFFYSCVQSYLKAHAIPPFDGSVAYAVEYSTLSGEELARLYAAAQDYASTLRAPDYSDSEHGSPAVLAMCRRQADSAAVARLAQEPAQD